MKTYADYVIYYANEKPKSVWLQVSPITHMKKHFKKYYSNAIGFKRIYHDGNSTSKYYKL